VLSPIKFQADMGILLAFMFVWNMAGALILLPALAYFLLPVSRREGTEQAKEWVPDLNKTHTTAAVHRESPNKILEVFSER
jgi:hypothetical protein